MKCGKISGHPTGFFFPNQTLVPFQSTNGPIKSDAMAPTRAARTKQSLKMFEVAVTLRLSVVLNAPCL